MLVWCVVGAACSTETWIGDDTEVEDPDETELPPPPPDFGVVTSPRTGDSLADHDRVDQIAIEGLHTLPGETVELIALVPPYDPDTSWVVVARGTTATTAVASIDDDPRYPFAFDANLSTIWPRGGLAYLKVRAAGAELVGFFHDADSCWAGWPSWRLRVQHCGSAYVERGIVVVSTDVDPQAVADAALYLDDKGRLTPTETGAYYAAIDAPATLAAFRSRYLTGDEINAAYYNAGDLGIGRDMHCGRTGTGGVACYVANYGEFGGAATLAIDELIAGRAAGGAGAGAFATVAMVYQPPIESPNAVQFMVYGPDQALVTEAILDTHGDNTAIPSNCLNCHGSHARIDAATSTVLDARFLPFDPATFEFADAPGLRRADQEDALRQLNRLMIDTDLGFGSEQVVLGMYGEGLEVVGTIADDSFVPPGWNGLAAEHVYREAVAPSCRGCHASREQNGGPEVWDFIDQDRFAGAAPSVASVVCGDGNDRVHRMPSAEITARQFWQGRGRAYLGAMLDLRGPCTP